MNDNKIIEYQKLWTNILETLSKTYEQDTLDEIFGESRNVVKVVNNLIYILVPSLYTQKRINQMYMKQILKISEQIYPNPVRFKFILDTEFLEEENKTLERETPQVVFQSNLNSAYTFQSFIVGKSNRYSQMQAFIVADQPGTTANPLYIFGGVGLGKTHLMQAIGNYVLDKDVNSKVLYIRSQDFINEYTKACQNKEMDEFRNKFYDLDYLLVDDIQMLSNAKNTQNEFFNLFNNLVDKEKQVVITSDRPAQDLKDMMGRLTSRFAGGQIVDITTPDLDLRVKILKRKLSESSDEATISDDILEYIASFYTNIRELEGGLRRILSYSTCFNRDIDLPLVQECLANVINIHENGTNDKYENIKSIVANYYNITVDDLIGKNRQARLVLPRHICMYLLKNTYNLTNKNIGSLMGGRDHSTVLSGCAKIEQEIKTNEELKMAIDTIKKKLTI